MADQAELTFVKAFANNLSQQPVNYPDDFQPPLENYLKRVPTLPVSMRFVEVMAMLISFIVRLMYHRLRK